MFAFFSLIWVYGVVIFTSKADTQTIFYNYKLTTRLAVISLFVPLFFTMPLFLTSSHLALFDGMLLIQPSTLIFCFFLLLVAINYFYSTSFNFLKAPSIMTLLLLGNILGMLCFIFSRDWLFTLALCCFLSFASLPSFLSISSIM
jgi:hypothetical protein